jgi:hypothetical protein
MMKKINVLIVCVLLGLGGLLSGCGEEPAGEPQFQQRQPEQAPPVTDPAPPPPEHPAQQEEGRGMEPGPGS